MVVFFPSASQGLGSRECALSIKLATTYLVLYIRPLLANLLHRTFLDDVVLYTFKLIPRIILYIWRNSRDAQLGKADRRRLHQTCQRVEQVRNDPLHSHLISPILLPSSAPLMKKNQAAQ